MSQNNLDIYELDFSRDFLSLSVSLSPNKKKTPNCNFSELKTTSPRFVFSLFDCYQVALVFSNATAYTTTVQLDEQQVQQKGRTKLFHRISF